MAIVKAFDVSLQSGGRKLKENRESPHGLSHTSCSVTVTPGSVYTIQINITAADFGRYADLVFELFQDGQLLTKAFCDGRVFLHGKFWTLELSHFKKDGSARLLDLSFPKALLSNHLLNNRHPLCVRVLQYEINRSRVDHIPRVQHLQLYNLGYGGRYSSSVPIATFDFDLTTDAASTSASPRVGSPTLAPLIKPAPPRDIRRPLSGGGAGYVNFGFRYLPAPLAAAPSRKRDHDSISGSLTQDDGKDNDYADNVTNLLKRSKLDHNIRSDGGDRAKEDRSAGARQQHATFDLDDEHSMSPTGGQPLSTSRNNNTSNRSAPMSGQGVNGQDTMRLPHEDLHHDIEEEPDNDDEEDQGRGDKSQDAATDNSDQSNDAEPRSVKKPAPRRVRALADFKTRGEKRYDFWCTFCRNWAFWNRRKEHYRVHHPGINPPLPASEERRGHVFQQVTTEDLQRQEAALQPVGRYSHNYPEFECVWCATWVCVYGRAKHYKSHDTAPPTPVTEALRWSLTLQPLNASEINKINAQSAGGAGTRPASVVRGPDDPGAPGAQDSEMGGLDAEVLTAEAQISQPAPVQAGTFSNSSEDGVPMPVRGPFPRLSINGHTDDGTAQSSMHTPTTTRSADSVRSSGTGSMIIVQPRENSPEDNSTSTYRPVSGDHNSSQGSSVSAAAEGGNEQSQPLDSISYGFEIIDHAVDVANDPASDVAAGRNIKEAVGSDEADNATPAEDHSGAQEQDDRAGYSGMSSHYDNADNMGVTVNDDNDAKPATATDNDDNSANDSIASPHGHQVSASRRDLQQTEITNTVETLARSLSPFHDADDEETLQTKWNRLNLVTQLQRDLKAYFDGHA
ncbi:uncharacterized protein HMPREF1541_00174 [Cyphellophora europaea CBS 101466]|uniref:Uncharacterized protein n=1 Tax=Cyphellophora europaea (strain CBS 101466) TaxID=1220924 RepID=W2SB86_CYPE1|nr:uncharacterized protein HMPREF1541_00174 [Cyphellophora europaea CBS 101466]ETN45991.1 hypothetical protein HMPREF1541_00174 [Cyphellophora europaea CBS 101466]